jgi:hypothetical protein
MALCVSPLVREITIDNHIEGRQTPRSKCPLSEVMK